MQIKIKENAKELYYIYNRSYNSRYDELLDIISGYWLTVDTNYLLPDSYMVRDKQYGIEILIHGYMVEEVIDDARIGMYRCDKCGNVQDSSTICSKCNKVNLPRLV